MTQNPGDGDDGNPYGVELYGVTSPSGSQFYLQTEQEAAWYADRRELYMQQNLFPLVSDLLDLDRILTLEVLVYRWSLWMGQGFDYLFSRIDENALKTAIKECSVELRQLKSSLGIDRATRTNNGESLADYIEKLLARAKVFGYHRNDQYELAVTKMYELRSMVKTYDRCDEEERRILDLSPETIMDWIRKFIDEEWDTLQESFRKDQAAWIREM